MENKYVRFWLRTTMYFTFYEGAAYESYLCGGQGLYFNPKSKKLRKYCFDRLIKAIEKIEKQSEEMKLAIKYAMDNCVDLIATEEGYRLEKSAGLYVENY